MLHSGAMEKRSPLDKPLFLTPCIGGITSVVLYHYAHRFNKICDLPHMYMYMYTLSGYWIKQGDNCLPLQDPAHLCSEVTNGKWWVMLIVVNFHCSHNFILALIVMTVDNGWCGKKWCLMFTLVIIVRTCHAVSEHWFLEVFYFLFTHFVLGAGTHFKMEISFHGEFQKQVWNTAVKAYELV